jgi:hypothetical protein
VAGDLLKFLDYVKGECASAGVKLRLDAVKRNKAGDLGYFNEDNKVLYVACLGPDWAMTMAHELSHIHQFLEKHPLWASAESHELEEWIAGRKRLNLIKAKSMCRAVQRLELDAERRTVALARKWNLTDDLATYVRNANRYIWSWEISRVNRAWPKWETKKVSEEWAKSILVQLPDRLMTARDIAHPPEVLVANAHLVS